MPKKTQADKMETEDVVVLSAAAVHDPFLALPDVAEVTTWDKEKWTAHHPNYHVYMGLDLTCVPDLPNLLYHSTHNAFDFIAVPLVHPRYRRSTQELDNSSEPLTRSDMIFDSSQWSGRVIGKLSPWLDLDSEHLHIRQDSEAAFLQEVAWADHVRIPSVLIRSPTDILRCGNFARMVNSSLRASNLLSVWVEVPVSPPQASALATHTTSNTTTTTITTTTTAGTTTAAPSTSTSSVNVIRGADRASLAWQIWRRICALCEYQAHVSVALLLAGDAPSKEETARWLGEPVPAIIVDTKIFTTNLETGLPQLSKAHQTFLCTIYQANTQLILRGKSKLVGGVLPYQEYLRQLIVEQAHATSQFNVSYHDYLQSPLQPLMDNLGSQVYETFERDPCKYAEYEKAIYLALYDRCDPNKKDELVVIMVVGAGRGPLVRCALRAAVSACVKVKVIAVEKNPNAVITLRNAQKNEWGSQVEVVSCDMRKWVTNERADILISELLGSFGDNELSPECLDGAQAYLKEGAISIPYNSVSYLAPISCPLLWSKIHGQSNATFSCTDFKRMETSYVVKLHNYASIATALPVFTFVHPNLDQPIDNKRYSVLKFPVLHTGVVHGFAGYFESGLYKKVQLSIYPPTHSRIGDVPMISWFPIFFPLRSPLYVEKGDICEVHFWRCVSTTKVWYEWCVMGPTPQPIHNPNGRSSSIGIY